MEMRVHSVDVTGQTDLEYEEGKRLVIEMLPLLKIYLKETRLIRIISMNI